jgi:hypothetical protein
LDTGRQVVEPLVIAVNRHRNLLEDFGLLKYDLFCPIQVRIEVSLPLLALSHGLYFVGKELMESFVIDALLDGLNLSPNELLHFSLVVTKLGIEVASKKINSCVRCLLQCVTDLVQIERVSDYILQTGL